MSFEHVWGRKPAVEVAGTVRLIAYEHSEIEGVSSVLDIQEYALPEGLEKRKRMVRQRHWDMLMLPFCHRVEIQFLPAG